MRCGLYILLLNMLSFCVCNAQEPQNINYYFRLFNAKGKIITKDSLVKNTLFILPNPGRILTTSYNDTTHFFYVKIRTTWPLFRLIWNHNNDIMEFTVDHRTGGMDIYLDSLVFKTGQFYIADDADKTWWKGLKIKIKEDGNNLHILKFNYNDFKTKESVKDDKKLKKVKL